MADAWGQVDLRRYTHTKTVYDDIKMNIMYIYIDLNELGRYTIVYLKYVYGIYEYVCTSKTG